MATDPAVLQTRLDQAETARHELLTGAKVVRIGEGDTKVDYMTFTQAEIGALQRYIAALKTELGQTVPKRRALGVSF